MCDYCVYPLVARFNFYNILEDKYIYIYIYILKFNIPLQKKKEKEKKGYTEINVLITDWPNSVIEYSQEGKSFSHFLTL